MSFVSFPGSKVLIYSRDAKTQKERQIIILTLLTHTCAIVRGQLERLFLSRGFQGMSLCLQVVGKCLYRLNLLTAQERYFFDLLCSCDLFFKCFARLCMCIPMGVGVLASILMPKF